MYIYIYNSISIYIYCCCWINSTFYQSLAGSSLHISKTWQVPRISILTQPLWIRVAPDVPGPPWSWWVPGRTVSPSSRVRAIAGWCGQSRSRWASRSCPSCWSHGSWRITGIESEKMCLDMKISEDLGYDIIWYTYVSCFVKSDNQLRQVVCNKNACGGPAGPAGPAAPRTSADQSPSPNRWSSPTATAARIRGNRHSTWATATAGGFLGNFWVGPRGDILWEI